jgi:hypothetical protein
MFLRSFSIFPAYAKLCRPGDQSSHLRRVLSECGFQHGTGGQLILGITLDQRAEGEPMSTRAPRVPFALDSSVIPQSTKEALAQLIREQEFAINIFQNWAATKDEDTFAKHDVA